MVVKVIKEGKDGWESIHSCEDVKLRRHDDRLEVEVHYPPPRKPHVISLPRDGDVAYVEDNGKTVSVKRWTSGNGEKKEPDDVGGGKTDDDLTNRPVTFRG